jgi:hypothetical protein
MMHARGFRAREAAAKARRGRGLASPAVRAQRSATLNVEAPAEVETPVVETTVVETTVKTDEKNKNKKAP